MHKLSKLLNIGSIGALKKGLWSFVIRLFTVLASFISGVLLARVLGVEQYGLYVYAFTVISFLSIPINSGIPNLILRETSRLQVNESWANIKGLWRFSIAVVLCFFIIVFSLFFSYYLASKATSDESFFELILIAILILPFMALGTIRDNSLLGLKFIIAGQLTSNIIRPTFFCIILFFLTTINTELTASYAMAINLFSFIFAFVIGTAIFFKYRPIAIKNETKVYYNIKCWVSAAIPLALLNGAQILNTQIDIFILGIYHDATQVGVYKVVVMGSSLVVFGLQVINVLAAPYIAKYYELGDLFKLQKIVTLACQGGFVLSLPVVLAMIFWGDSLLSLIFGEEYSRGDVALGILAVGQLFSAFFGSVLIILNMTGNEKLAFKGVLISTIINLSLNLFLIPSYGIEGAAFATATSLIAWNIILSIFVYNKLKIKSVPIHV